MCTFPVSIVGLLLSRIPLETNFTLKVFVRATRQTTLSLAMTKKKKKQVGKLKNK